MRAAKNREPLNFLLCLGVFMEITKYYLVASWDLLVAYTTLLFKFNGDLKRVASKYLGLLPKFARKKGI